MYYQANALDIVCEEKEKIRKNLPPPLFGWHEKK
jgi:hypothetical protein